MAPNLALLAYAPDITGLAPEPIVKRSRWERVYDFIVQSQTRRAEHEIARYLQRAKQAPRP